MSVDIVVVDAGPRGPQGPIGMTGSGGSGPSVLNGGSTSHSDGTDTITASARYFIGNLTPSTDDSGLMIERLLSGSYFTGTHCIRDGSKYVSFSGTGLAGYASFDGNCEVGGTNNWGHQRIFQARPLYSGSGVNAEIAGLTFQLTHTGTGSATNVYAVTMSDALGTGPIALQAVVYCATNLTRGTANYFSISLSPLLPSYHAGRYQFGTAPQITAAGFTTYGAFLTHDATGNLITNPNLTLINGELKFTSATARLLANAGDLELDAATGSSIKALKPVKFPSYTVALLPAAASYPYARAFVTDATSPTFGATVAGSGAVKTPVWSNGTNWIVG